MHKFIIRLLYYFFGFVINGKDLKKINCLMFDKWNEIYFVFLNNAPCQCTPHMRWDKRMYGIAHCSLKHKSLNFHDALAHFHLETGKQMCLSFLRTVLLALRCHFCTNQQFDWLQHEEKMTKHQPTKNVRCCFCCC